MAKTNINDQLKRRMAATQQASDLQASNEAYAQLFQQSPLSTTAKIQDLPSNKLMSFFTADIGFKPYPPEKLKAFAEQLSEEGLLVRIIVRQLKSGGGYEILAGHNRVNAAKLAGWTEIPSEIVEADDARAIVIATSTNLIQRQNLSIIERGKAYKALLDAKNRNGQHHTFASESTFGDSRQRSDREDGDSTFGENHQRYNARKLVAEFFNVSEYEIRKAIKLTRLIPELQDILENKPKQLNLACADIMADYDAESQKAFIEMCTIEGYQINKAAMRHIVSRCPPPAAKRHDIFTAWREARAIAESAWPPRRKKSHLTVNILRPIWTSWVATGNLKSCFWSSCRNGRSNHPTIKNALYIKERSLCCGYPFPAALEVCL